MLDSASRLGCDLPHIERGFHEVIGTEGALVGQTLFGATFGHRPIETTLADNNDPFSEIAKHRVCGLAIRTPGDRPGGTLGLLPNNLAPQQHAEVVLQNADDVGRQASIWLASQVGHIDRHTTPRLQNPEAAGKHIVQHLEILQIRGWYGISVATGIGITGNR